MRHDVGENDTRDNPLLAAVFNETTAGAEVPALGCLSTDAFTARPLNFYRTADPFWIRARSNSAKTLAIWGIERLY